MEFLTWLLSLVRDLEPLLDNLANHYAVWFYVCVFLIIFAETGLVVTPFLPGDSLLFLLGSLAASGNSQINLTLLLLLLFAAAVLGDAVNYAIGYRLGPAVFRYEKSWLFNRKYLIKAQEFYEKYGNKTIIIARFVPIVRTFAPFVAGIGKMNYGRFAFYNVIGGAAWVLGCTLAGFWFGQIPWVKKHFELVVLAIIVLSVLPMVIEILMTWRRRPTPAPEISATSEVV